MKKKAIKKWIKRIIIIAILGFLGYSLLKPRPHVINYRTVAADVGDIKVVISGAGTVETATSRNASSNVTAKITKLYYDEGDYVSKGTILARLDSKDYQMQINTQKNSIEQAKISKQASNRQVENLMVVSNGTGFIRNLTISEGSYLVTNSKVCEITVPNKYEITLQFLASNSSKISIGDKANIFLLDSYSYIDGEVSYVGSEKTVLNTGSNVIDVIIKVEDPRYVLDGLRAEASIKTLSGIELTSANPSYFAAARDTQVLSGSTGKVTKLYVKEGQEIKEGDIICELQNEDLNDSIQNTNISIKNLEQQLEYSESKLADYVIRADMAGTITSQKVKEGDWIQVGMTLCTISDLDTYEFKLPIDELDISKVKLNTKVKVTLDALEETKDNPIEGTIVKLPLEGVTVGGVTDYYVTVQIPYVEGLLIGMNADGDITIKESLNATRIPIECVEKEDGKYYVQLVTGVSGDTIVDREVEIGIKDNNYYEITKGLESGDKVVLPEQGIVGGMLNMF